jgi:hypothetical protein
MRKNLILVALGLPVIAFAALWGWTHHKAQQGTDWEVPIQGYDPRDLLRGHYITYQYDWPGLEEEVNLNWIDYLCLEGNAPKVEQVYDPAAATGYLGLSSEEPDCTNFVRSPTYSQEGIRGLRTGILYIPQTEADELGAKLRDRDLQGVIHIRVRDDGLISPQRISFRPRPPEPEGTPEPDSPLPIMLTPEE